MNIREDGNFYLQMNSEIEDDDLYIAEVGRSYMEKGLVVPSRVRNTYLLHFLISGTGQYCGKPLSAGNGFLILPNQLHNFSYNAGAPTLHYWIAFYGKKAGFYLRKRNISIHNHVFPFQADTFNDRMNEYFDIARVRDPNFSENYAIFYYMLSTVLTPRIESGLRNGMPDEHVQRAITYIQYNYYRRITIQEIAGNIYVSPKYLSRIFSERMEMSLQEFIIKTKLNYAERLLKTDMKIQEIAYSVGYENSLNFCQIFKKYYGITPSTFRKLP